MLDLQQNVNQLRSYPSPQWPAVVEHALGPAPGDAPRLAPELSSFRHSLGSILAENRGASEIDEEQLTAWMHEHLRVVAVPVHDADRLDGTETEVLILP